MKWKVSDYIAEFLRVQNIEYVFEMAGGMIAHLLDSLYQQQVIHILSMHHEQSAAFAADAIGRLTGKPGVALATSGPGATNLLTGIGSCYFDSSPALFITGQVNTYEQKQDRPIRQLGFQETDIASMARPITKACFVINDPKLVVNTLQKAYQTAISGRPGPVLIDIAMDVQRAVIEAPAPSIVLPKDQAEAITANCNLAQLFTALSNAKRPLVLAGGGLKDSGCKQLFRQWIETLNIPVVTSLMGLDVLPFQHPLRMGYIGSYGNRWANHALGSADVLVVLGSRLDIRQTGADTDAFAANKTIFHIDCEPGEVNNRIKGCNAIISELHPFLEQAMRYSKPLDAQLVSSWTHEIRELMEQWPDTSELTINEGINPNQFFHQLSQASQATKGYVVDVGSHQMWAAQSLELTEDQFFMTSGGMGAMGFALPAAIGASLAQAKAPVTVIVGDGAMQVNLQELQTIVRNKIPLKIVVVNNQSLGMITQFQDSYFDSRYQSTYWGYSAPDFTKIAKAYGIKNHRIETPAQAGPMIKAMWEDPSQPFLLEVMVKPHLHVYPKIAFGRPITEMEPLAKPIAFEGT